MIYYYITASIYLLFFLLWCAPRSLLYFSILRQCLQITDLKHLSSQVRLIDAGFVWTEPHSKRIKMKLTIQKEVRKQGDISMCGKIIFVISDMRWARCFLSRKFKTKPLIFLKILRIFIKVVTSCRTCIHYKVTLRLFYQKNKRSVCSWQSYVRVASLAVGCHCISLTFSENLSLVLLLFVQLEGLYNSACSSPCSHKNSSITIQICSPWTASLMNFSHKFLSSPGDEWRHPTTGVCGRVCHPVPDVWRLPPCGGQRLLEGRRSSSSEGRYLWSYTLISTNYFPILAVFNLFKSTFK